MNFSESIKLLTNAPWDKEDFIDPSNHVRSMITDGEKRLLHWLAKEWYTGSGEIVDLGCYVGADTVLFADGVQKNSRRHRFPARPIIHAFDIFEQAPEGDPKFKVDTPLIQEYANNISKYNKYISTYFGDISGFFWQRGRDIEILFNDISKSPEINSRVINEFFPSLVPGKSILLQQDYYDDHFWIPISMEKLEPYFKPFVGPLGSKPIDHVDLLRQIRFNTPNQWIGGFNGSLVLAVGRAMGGH
ncbi:MAG: hypothetical protein KIT65_17220 [Xanthobacteraceae bacterium]|nr:hypothetical protein [Xanthobacteraceae bacterium]